MSELKDNVNKIIKNFKSYKNAKDDSIKWFNEAKGDRKNKSVQPLNAGDTFKAGKIYKFKYDATTERLPFFDATPIILSLGRIKYKNSYAERGLNLNYLPKDIRVHVMDVIRNAYKNSILNESKGKKSSNAELQSGLPMSYNSLRVMIGQVYAQYAIRNYTTSNMSDVYSIAYENWDKAILIETDNFIRTSQGQVHLEYYEYIKKVINKK